MTKVHIWPTPAEIGEDNGIGRIIHAQYRLLPEHGIELVPFTQAEVIAAHTQQAHLPRVDVLHCHGIYWTGDPNSGKYNSWHDTANQRIMEAARRSQVITVPSKWVQRPFQYDMRISPVVIDHGIDLAEWEVSTETEDFVLWNKNRNTDVCNPKAAIELAKRGVKVFSTFNTEQPVEHANLKIVGKMPHTEMKALLRRAKIYLGTTQETYGVGTVEALALGIPVLGFDWGGTSDLITHKVNGYLVRPYDYEALYEGYNWLIENWKSASEAARDEAELHDWSKVMAKYASLYEAVAKYPQEEKVSIVITNYNYAKYVGEAIHSALAQTVCDEVVVIDDGSTDNSKDILKSFEAEPKVKIIYTENKGVAAARNLGISKSKGDFIICLDADDSLHPKYAEVLQAEMKANRDYGIAYTGLTVVRENGDRSNTTWPPEFDWELMTTKGSPPPNCIPSASMFRKSMWERAGGYRQALHPAEDVEFWVRGLSMGFTAKKVTPDPLFNYRTHSVSASRTKKYVPIDGWLPFINDKQYPIAAPAVNMPKVMSHHFPVVSVIIPVSEEHAEVVKTAIESVIGQTYRNWEVILIDDSGKQSSWGIALQKHYPFIVYRHTTPKHRGVGVARNMGLEIARAPYVMFLDADDYLHPKAIEILAEVALKGKLDKAKYYYTDYRQIEDAQVKATMDYNPERLVDGLIHAVTAFVPTSVAQSVKFDESLELLEDWEFYVRCALSGCYGIRVAQPLLYVRMGKRTRSTKPRKIAISMLREQYSKKIGEIPMSCCPTGSVATSVPSIDDPLSGGLVRMQYVGPQVGGTTWGGPGRTPSGRSYVGGNNVHDRFVDVLASDATWLKSFPEWKEVLAAPKEDAGLVTDVVEPELSLPEMEVAASKKKTKKVADAEPA